MSMGPNMHDLTLLAAMLNALRAPAMVIDADERISVINETMKAVAPAARAGDALSLALRAPDLLDAVRCALADGTVQTAIWRQHVPLDRVFDAYISPLEVSPQRFVMVTLRDLSDERRMERMRVDFIANVSHELRTPLASLLGFVETLQGPARDDAGARERFLDIMAEQGRRMSRLIDDLLSLSRVEQRQHLRPSASVELVSMVQHVIDGLAPIARERKVTLQFDAPDALNLIGDRDELIRLAENLIGNAIKYGSLPERESSVEVSITVSDGEARLRVRDHGAGIAREHIPRLTERFYRIDAGASRANGGTGLGLALVKHILMRHRGRLEISSNPGDGACFDAWLPLS